MSGVPLICHEKGNLDPVTGQRLLSHAEEHSARTVAAARVEAAEARVAELEALLREKGGLPCSGRGVGS